MAVRQILPEYLRKSFDIPPLLNCLDRARYGYIPAEIEKLANDIRSPKNKLGFLLQFYYFQIARRFYSVETFHKKDIQSLARKYKLPADLSGYSGTTVTNHKNMILDILKFRKDTADIRSELSVMAVKLAQKEIRPRLIFGELSNWLFESRIEGLSYYPLAEIVTNALVLHENTIETTLNSLLTPEAKIILNDLVGIDVDAVESPVFRELTAIDQSRAPKGIKSNCSKLGTIQEILCRLPLLSTLQFSPETIEYYAETALSFDTHQLVRRREQSYLYIYCFLIHQQRIIQDCLIDSILFTCQGREKFWLKKKNEDIIAGFEFRKKQAERIRKRNKELAELKENVNIVSHDRALSNEIKIQRMTELLAQDDLLEQNALAENSNDPESEEPVEHSRFHFEENDSKHLQNRVAPPLKLITFDKDSSEDEIYAAVDHFRRRNGTISATAPMMFLKDEEILALTDEKKKFNGSLYKVFLFKAAIKGIKSGRLNLQDSYKYQSLESYLINNEWWKAHRQEILEQTGLLHFADVTTVLDTLRNELQNQRRTTEQNLKSGKNVHALLIQKTKLFSMCRQ